MLSNIDFGSHTDDNTSYVIKDYKKEIIESMQNATNELFQWFLNNQMKAKEVAGWRLSVEMVFLEISQNSQENTCARVPFLIKLRKF